MFDPNLRFEVCEAQSRAPNAMRTMGPGSIKPILHWLDQKGIIYFYCDSWQYTWTEGESEEQEKIPGWDSWQTYKIKIFPPQIQFLKQSDYAMTKLRWHGVYEFCASTQDPVTLNGYFKL